MDRVNEIKQKAENDHQLTLRQQMSMVGKVVGLRLGIRKAGFRVRPLLAEMATNIRYHTRRGTTNYDGWVKITPTWIALCDWIIEWTDHELWRHMRLETPTTTLTADASEYGWCGHNNEQSWIRRGLFTTTEQSHHHNIQEGLAYNKTIQYFVEETKLFGTLHNPICITQETDNKIVLKCNRALSCKALQLCCHRDQLQDWMDFRHIQSHPVYIPKTTMDQNRIADVGSRRASHWHRWQLKPTTFDKIVGKFQLNRHNGVDLFTEPASAQTPLMVTEEWHPHSMWTDALSRPWSPLNNPSLKLTHWLWIFPPPRMLVQVSRRIVDTKGPLLPMLIVVPHNPTATWWKTLHTKTTKPTHRIGRMRDELIPPEGRKNAKKTHQPPNWELAVLPIIPRQRSPDGQVNSTDPTV